MEIKLSYNAIESENGNLNEEDYDNYMISPGQIIIVKAVAINPLEKTLKETEKDVFEFDNFKVSRKMQKRENTSWEKIYTSLKTFLEIRADDSRVYNMKDLPYFEGLGYCISTEQLRDFISKESEKNTSVSEFPLLFWPRMKKDDSYQTRILIPSRDYSNINNENAQIVLNAKNYCSGLEKQVVDTFKDANQTWYEKETGFNKDNLPQDKGGIKRERFIADGKYAFVNLVREEKPQYKEIIDTLLTEVSDLENEVALKGYKFKKEKGKTYVNIKNLYERLDNNRLIVDDLIKIQGRYEIVP
ncbi:MAG: hypothetical protein ACP5OG_03255 [Candidatus Nanoarchaeia archaeon]